MYPLVKQSLFNEEFDYILFGDMHINKINTKFKKMNKITLLIVGILALSIISFVSAQVDDWREELICSDGDKKPCGSNVGACKQGERICVAGVWGDCIGAIEPQEEICNNQIDEDCNGQVDDCFFEFPIPGWVLVALGVLMFIGAWVYEKMVVVKNEEIHQEEESE